MCLGWLKVIFDEGLYDEVFVRDWCVGLRDKKQQPGVSLRIADITGIAEGDVLAARMC